MALERTEGCLLSYGSSLGLSSEKLKVLRGQELERARAFLGRKRPDRRRYSGHILELMKNSENLEQKLRIV